MWLLSWAKTLEVWSAQNKAGTITADARTAETRTADTIAADISVVLFQLGSTEC